MPREERIEVSSDFIAEKEPRSPWLLAVAAAALIPIVLLVRQYTTDPLAQFMLQRRVVEARLTHFGHASLPVTRSEQLPAVSSDLAALEQLQSAVRRERTPENLHRLGAATLAIGKAREAKVLFDEASLLAPKNAALLADLAAAEMTLGRIADAAEYAARALAIDAEQPAAAFNWALALEKLSNRPAAVAAWRRSLALDPDGGWADEARQHLSRLLQPRPRYEEERRLLVENAEAGVIERVVRRFPQRSRGFAQNYVLPRWVEKGDAGDLRLMTMIAQTRAALGDPYLHDIVRHATANREAVTAGIREFTSARGHEEQMRWDQASERFSRAADLLTQAGSPLAIGAAIYAAQGEHTSGRSAAALARLKAVDARLAASGDRYPTMAAESAWVRALIAGRLGEPQQSLDAYRYALAQAERAGEVEHVAALSAMVAWVLDTIGDPSEADLHRLASLRRNEEINAAPERMYTSYLDASYVALRQGRPHLALAFVDGMVPFARKDAHPLQLAETATWRALGLIELGETEAARESLATARAHATRVPVEASRDFTMANIDYTTGRLEMAGRPAQAVFHFTSAVDIWERYGWRAHTASGLLARGEAQLRLQNTKAAERDFRAGIAEIEKQRATLEQPGVRVAYFERSDRVFDRLIELLLSQGQTTEALTIVERKRARFLLDQIASRTGTPAVPFEAKELARSVRGPMAVLEIALLDGGAELWLVQDGQIRHARSSATRKEIESAVSRHLMAIDAGDEKALRATGRWLHEQLFAPLLSRAKGVSDLVLVGEGVLQSFPFATLVTESGAYVVDRYSVAIAPSASVFLRGSAESGSGTMLAVAQPAPAGFAPLMSVQREATEIAKTYRRARLSIGTQITAEEFLKTAEGAALIHFAGHATADADQPATSSLIFQSPEGSAPQRLTAEQIGRSTFVNHPLVVLAACSTARGKERRTEGVDSLAAAFLHAGARGVTATLWDIDDESSSRLFRSFHQNLRAGGRASDALRDAQRALLHSKEPRDRNPAVWGSVTLIGTL